MAKKAMPKRKSGTSKMAAGCVYALAELVDYAEDSVVSRTLAENKAGTVTLFAFDEDQALSEHTAPFDALLAVLDGEAEVTVAGEPLAVHTGEAVVLPADKPHAVRAPERFKMMLVMVRS